MKSFRTFFLLLVTILAGSCGSALAQSVRFSNIQLKHNVKVSGRDMLQFWYEVDVAGIKGHNIRVCMFIDIPKEKGHIFADGRKMQRWSEVLTCIYASTHFSNKWIGYYNDELNPLPGKNTYYTRLFVWDDTDKKWIGHSDFLSYDMEGSIKSPQAQQQHNPVNNLGGSNNSPQAQQKSNPLRRVEVQKPCLKCNGTGFLHSSCRHSESDSQKVFCNACKTYHCSLCTSHSDCFVCNGRGHHSDGTTCSSCHGTGLQWERWCTHHWNDSSYTPYIYCDVCKTRHCSKCLTHDRCYMCYGKGYTIDYEYR